MSNNVSGNFGNVGNVGNVGGLKFDPLYPETKGDWQATLSFGNKWGIEGVGDFTFGKNSVSLNTFLTSLFNTVQIGLNNTITVTVFKREILKTESGAEGVAWVCAGYFAIPRELRRSSYVNRVDCSTQIIFSIERAYLREAEEGKMVIYV